MDTTQSTLQSLAESAMPTIWGNFKMITYESGVSDWMPHLVMISEHTDFESEVLVRIHSECITGDLFGSKRCDCGQQFESSMEWIGKEGGVMIYLRQEGRGIGLVNKLKAYNLQDTGLSTIEANHQLGFESDLRRFNIAIEILSGLGAKNIRLLTNNPDKIAAFEATGIKVLERIPLNMKPHHENLKYLQTKKSEMGHLLNL